MPNRTSIETLSPRAVRLAGAALILAGLSLPWVWLRTHRPAAGPVVRKGALRPELRRLPPGTFLMGSPGSEPGRYINERQHEVVIQTAFAISVTEVTQGQYEAVMGKNPSRFLGDPDRPVENVSWLDAVTYCNRLSEREGKRSCYRIDGSEVTWPEGLRCEGYRLPTEAEWEYAARADGKTAYAGSDRIDDVAWYGANSQNTTHPVASLQANAWGLYDFSGNVWEWVWDWHEADYRKLPRTDPVGPTSGSNRVGRGGSWAVDAQFARVAYRSVVVPGFRFAYQGFRVSRSSP